MFHGYDISPQALDLCKPKANQKLHFHLADILNENVNFDLLLVMDILEHLEDYFGFLRGIRDKAQFKIFHIPLDLSIYGLLSKKYLDLRSRVGHLHYFTKDIALQFLKETGYTTLDWLYTTTLFSPEPRSRFVSTFRPIVKIAYLINKDWTAITTGGLSVLILTQ